MDWFLDRHPEMLEELQQRVKEGRLGIEPGSFCNPDNPFMEPEAMIRNLVVGRRWEAVRIEHRGDRVRFQIRPWEIVTLRFAPVGRRA